MLLLSCTKGSGNIYVEGKTYNPVTGAPIPNVKIELIRTNKPGAGDPFTGGTATVKEVYSDANGNFVIEHLGALHGDYHVLPTVDGNTYQIIGWENAGGLTRAIEVSEETYDDLKVVTKGKYGYHIKNVNCIDSNDSMHRELTWLGCYEASGVSGEIPIGDYRWDWYVIRNGVRTDCTKVFTVYENDTTFVELFY